MACLNWSDLKHILGAESCAVVLHFDVGVGARRQRQEGAESLLVGSAYDAGDGRYKIPSLPYDEHQP